MAEIIQATWEDFRQVVISATRELTICTPYFSTEGVNHFFDHMQATPNLFFITRLSPSDWLHGISDPEALTTLLEILSEGSIITSIHIHQRLHAKAYIANDSLGLLGSANLSSGGFEKNFELMARIESEEARKAHEIIHYEASLNGRPITVSALREWVDKNKRKIIRLRPVENNEAEQLAEMQRELDNMLGFGRHTTPVKQHLSLVMGKFVEWLKKNLNLSGADVLYERYQNTGGQNLTGHFKQSYYGVSNFLLENKEHIQILSLQLNSLKSSDVFQPGKDLLDAWLEYLDIHATDKGDAYDYAILRGIIPPNLGGTRLGGGGGSSTLKRMFPLVARFIDEKGVL
ncbi:MAG: hypothetical protein BWX92_02777 [Deltaproteobacteria bacterium ADurb.Bin135]|nr:MAG: hypothetical protein BWX92_02777 [Deltaproteobacteria bacterium ADurb.Bin135]